jgi:hypothetical protein
LVIFLRDFTFSVIYLTLINMNLIGALFFTMGVEKLVSDTLASLDDVDIPVILRSSIEKHEKNLVTLAHALLAGGQTEEEVRVTLDSLFQSYKAELTRTILLLRDDKQS